VRTALLFVAGVAIAAAAPAQPTAAIYAGQPLAEALQTLQASGLRLVFSSTTVRPELNVRVVPRSTQPRRRLEELLTPHGLAAEEGPGGILQIVRARRPAPPPAARPREPSADPRPIAPAHREYVTVAPTPPDAGSGDAASATLGRAEIEQMAGELRDQPFRVVQALPGVSAIDDVRSDFTSRGSPYRHVETVIDGVATPWLRHTAHASGAAASLPMLTGDVLDSMTLRTGAYPRRYGDRLGAQLELTLREGSRDARAFRAMVGGTNATIVGEGPLGAGRGSWIAAARRSYAEWPALPEISTRSPFGFVDGVARLVLDVRPTQQLSLSLVAGRSDADVEDDLPQTAAGAGTNQTAVVNLGWRSLFAASVFQQRVYLVHHSFTDRLRTGHVDRTGGSDEAAYRADLTRRAPGGVVEFGGLIAHTAQTEDARAASSWTRAAYAHYGWRPSPALTVSPGVRVAAAGPHHARTISRWLLGDWVFRPSWRATASTGVSYQPPELLQWRADPSPPGPERAAYYDAGIERQLPRGLRWRTSLFARREADIFRANANALRGSSRGVEVTVERRAATGLTGWAAYSFGRTRYTDVDDGVTFRAEFDQRHAVNALGSYRFRNGTGVSGTIRAGSGFPGLPAYRRVDLRADRPFRRLGHRFTIYGEVVNVLNHVNVAAAGDGAVEPLLSRRLSAGAIAEF
jgi:hypothetical protein